MPAPLRIGFIGCGRATATLHLPALRRVEGVEAGYALELGAYLKQGG